MHDNGGLSQCLMSGQISLVMVLSLFAGLAIMDEVTDDAAAAPTFLVVSDSGGGDYTSIQDAVDAIAPGGVIRVWAGKYTETVEVSCPNAVNSPRSYSVVLTVRDEDAVHLRINCGDNGYTPQGWEHDDAYVQGGVDYVFDGRFDTSGVAQAAPREVYRTCRHRIRDVETSYGYQIPSLPDGDYSVRLHFGDAGGPRSIDVWIEGEEVGGQKIETTVTDSGGWQEPTSTELGTVDIKEGSELTEVILQPLKKQGDWVMNFKSLTLSPTSK